MKKAKNQFQEIEEAINDPKGIQIFVLEKPKPYEPIMRPQCSDRDASYSEPLVTKQLEILSLRMCTPMIYERDGVIEEFIEFVHPKFGCLRLTITDDGKVSMLADGKYDFEQQSGVGRIVKVGHYSDPY